MRPWGRIRVQELVQPLSLCWGFGADSLVSSLGSWGAGASLRRAPTSTSAPPASGIKGPAGLAGD